MTRHALRGAPVLAVLAEEHAALLDCDEAKWSTLIRKLNLKID